MHRTVIALAIAGLAVSGAGVASAAPGNGNGAVKSGLSSEFGLAPILCAAATAEEAGKQTANGFAVLNAPGKPSKSDKGGPARKLIGQVALKGADANETYSVFLASTNGVCGDSVGSFQTNEQGHGTLSFQQAGKGAGTYYVVISRVLDEDLNPLGIQEFASAPVTVR